MIETTTVGLIQETQCQWFEPKRLRALLLTVDGAGSGIDADLLDGQEGAYYLPAASYTAADVLTKIKTVDGAGSGLDADLLDSYEAAAFPRLAINNTFAGTITAGAISSRGVGAGFAFYNRDTDTQAGQWYSPSAGDLRLYNGASSSDRLRIDSSGNLYIVAGTIKTLLNVTWDMGGYTAGAPAATGYVTVKVAGTTYKLLTST